MERAEKINNLKLFRGVWVMTEMNMKKGITEAYTEAAEQLMEYMNGGNDGNVTMEATKPNTVVYIMDKVMLKYRKHIFHMAPYMLSSITLPLFVPGTH